MFETTTRISTMRPGVNGTGKPFTAWKTGGKAQIFCGPGLLPPLGSCGRRCVTQALADGCFTVAMLREGVPMARALVGRGEAVDLRA